MHTGHAMCPLLACRDIAERQDEMFAFPFPIDGDKVHGMTVKYSMNKEPNWTKALKYMLADLKQALVWMNKRNMLQGTPPLQMLGQEGAFMNTVL